jgi:hypothetical protein
VVEQHNAEIGGLGYFGSFTGTSIAAAPQEARLLTRL